MTRDVHSWPASLKAYVQANAGFEIILRTLSGYPTYFVVLAKRAGPETEITGTRMVPIPNRRGHDGPTHDAHGRVVLVGVPHFVEDAEPIIGDIVGSSVIRLMAFYDLDALRGNQAGKHRFHEFVEGRPCRKQRKDKASVALQTRRGNSPNQVVKQRAEIMNKVSCDESEDPRYRLMVGDLEDIAASLEITPTLDGIRVETQELFDLNIEVVEVKLRSLKPPFKVGIASRGDGDLYDRAFYDDLAASRAPVEEAE